MKICDSYKKQPLSQNNEGDDEPERWKLRDFGLKTLTDAELGFFCAIKNFTTTTSLRSFPRWWKIFTSTCVLFHDVSKNGIHDEV